jgi:hypothetical protein
MGKLYSIDSHPGLEHNASKHHASLGSIRGISIKSASIKAPVKRARSATNASVAPAKDMSYVKLLLQLAKSVKVHKNEEHGKTSWVTSLVMKGYIYDIEIEPIKNAKGHAKEPRPETGGKAALIEMGVQLVKFLIHNATFDDGKATFKADRFIAKITRKKVGESSNHPGSSRAPHGSIRSIRSR